MVIEPIAQGTTVALLAATGLVVSTGGRVRRQSAARAEAHANAVGLLHRVTETAAAGGAVDRVAAEGRHQLLGARRVSILRRSPAGLAVTLDVGQPRGRSASTAPSTWTGKAAPPGHHRVLGGTMVLPHGGVVLDLAARGRPVGYLLVVPAHDVPADRTTRLAVAAIANQLAIAATKRPQP